jgi:LuxR family transcriptional regulator, maltose regulon positive regulatory protein
MFAMGVVLTTILPPRVAHSYVKRAVIEQLVQTIGAARVATVSSPGGFGKTTAMLRWAEILGKGDRPILWIAARAGIDSLETFLRRAEAG